MKKEGPAGSQVLPSSEGASGLVPLSGATHAGQPLSLNRAAPPDLAPWIGRITAADVVAPPGSVIACGMFNDLAQIRVLLSGTWEAVCADGHHRYNLHGERQALFFGPHSRMMPIGVEGSFRTVGISLRPGVARLLRTPTPGATLDLIRDRRTLPELDRLSAHFDPSASAAEWAQTIEDLARRSIARYVRAEPDAVTAAFEQLAFAAPETPVGAFAERHGIGLRTLERIVKRDFGLTPKQVLRRARALDMASQLLGVAAPDEADALALRYFDQSHLIRECIHFFGMTPQQLAARPNTLLRITLEGRQARRLEELRRMEPGSRKPWRADPAVSRTAS